MTLLKKRQVDMGAGPVPSTLFRLALPSIFSMFFHTLFHLVDTVFVAWLGENAMAAMALTFPVMFITFALVNGMAVGATTRMSSFLGKNQPEEASSEGNAALALVILLAIPITPLVFKPVSNAFFSMFGGGGDVLAETWRYSFWMVLANIPMAFSLLADAVFRSQGDTITPMNSMLLGNGINVFLDPLFIFGFGWGIAGASIATLLGRLISCCYLLYRLRTHSSIIPRLAWMSDYPARWLRIATIGFPVAVSQGSMALGSALLNRVLASFGPAALGAWMLGNRVEMFAFLPVFGINGALIPFVAFNMGRGHFKRIMEALRAVIIAASVMMLTTGILIYIWPHWILTLFRPSPTVMAMAVASIRASAVSYLFVAIDISFWGIFQGSGHPVYGMIAQILRTLVVRIPAAMILASFFGIKGVWWCQPVSAVASFAASCFFIGRVIRMIREHIDRHHPPVPIPCSDTAEQVVMEPPR